MLFCSCSKTKKMEKDFEKYLEEHTGIIDIIKDDENINNKSISIKSIYDSIDTSVINLKDNTSNEDVFNLYIYKKDDSICLSLIMEDTSVFDYVIYEEDIVALQEELDSNKESITTGELLEIIKDNFDVDFSELLAYDFTINDFTFDPDTKLFTLKQDKCIDLLILFYDKLDSIFSLSNYADMEINKESIETYLQDNNISFKLQFAFDNKHFTQIIFSLNQDHSQDINYEEFGTSENHVKNMNCMVVADLTYEEDALEEIDIECSFSLEQFNARHTKKYLYMGYSEINDENENSTIAFNLNACIKKNEVSMDGSIGIDYYKQVNSKATEGEKEKASGQSVKTVNCEGTFALQYDGNIIKFTEDINGNSASKLTGTYLEISVRTDQYNQTSISTKVVPYGTANNYELSIAVSGNYEQNTDDNSIDFSLSVDASDNTKKYISIEARANYNNGINALEYKSKCSIKELEQYSFLNCTLSYKTIDESEIPEHMK